MNTLRYKTKVVIVGAGQAGLSAAYYLKKKGWRIGRDFVILDDAEQPGGAWQYRWDSLTLSTVNKIHDLPGMSLESTLLHDRNHEVQANIVVPHYYKLYEETFGLKVYRPIKVHRISLKGAGFSIETSAMVFSAMGVINATGTWNNPYVPIYPGWESFQGEHLHTRDFKTVDYFKGKRVLVVGGGISAIQLLDQVSKVTDVLWVTRQPPVFREGPFDDVAGQEAVARVEERVRKGLPPLSVVSVTGLPMNDAIKEMESRGVLNRLPMFQEITKHGVRWLDGREEKVDVIFWNTGFRAVTDHLKEVVPQQKDGGILMDGRLATRVVKEPRIHLVGYGPSASTIGANRAGRAAVDELLATLGLNSTTP